MRTLALRPLDDQPVETPYLPPPGRRTLTGTIHGGASLPRPVQAKMERSFGADFDGVSVHVDGQAEQIGARAFASGESLHFAAGAYAPESQEGQVLIAHELTHVMQQRSGRARGPADKGGSLLVDPALEREADELGARAARGERVEIAGGAAASAGVVQGKDAAPEEEPAEGEEAGDEGGPVTLDDICGEGFEEDVLLHVDDVNTAAGKAEASIAAWEPADRAELQGHVDGADALARSLEAAADALVASAKRKDGAIEWDKAKELALNDKMDRCEAALKVLADVDLLAREAQIRAIAAAIGDFGEASWEKLMTLIIKAQSGRDQLEHLVAAFQAQQATLDKAITSATKDTIGIVTGGVSKTEVLESYKNLQAAAKILNDWWSYYGQWEKVAKPPKTTWDTVRTAKTFGTMIAKPVAELIGGGVKAAYPEIKMLIDCAQLAAEVGRATGADAVMLQLLAEAKRVQAEYGELIAWLDNDAVVIKAAVDLFEMLRKAGPAAEAALRAIDDRIHATLDAYGGLWP